MAKRQITRTRDFSQLGFILLAFSFCFILSRAEATNYYFSASLGDDSRTSAQAQSSSTPWKTISKLNATTFAAGDAIFFNKGDTFYGSIIVSNSGSSGSPITFGAYGSGANPIITGFTTITGWTNTGGGIYSKVISCESSINILTINGVQYAMGRYPNTGWLNYESFSGMTSITDAQLSATPVWTGAEAVIRKNDWEISRNAVTSHTAQTLTFTGSSVALANGWGYYIQNSVSTLDQFGEWYYNPTSSTLYMYFGAVDPATKTVQIPTIDKLVTFTSGISYITFNNISFKGSNKSAIYAGNNTYVTVKNCNIDFSGNIGLRFSYCNNTTLENNTINHSNDQGIATWSTSNNATITGNTVKNTELIPAHGVSDYMSGVGIFAFQGDNILVKYNSIDSSSYCGIIMGGNNQIVRKNFITNSMLNKQDGAGIYYGLQAAYSNMTIDSNIVLSSYGGYEGKPVGSTVSAANGIYIDYGTTGGVAIKDNTTANCNGHGIFDHASRNLTITGNTSYNNIYQLTLQETPSLGVSITGLTIKNNKFIAKESAQLVFWGRLNAGSVWAEIGALDNNYYARPISDAASIKAMVNVWEITAQSLATFKGLTGQDLNSLASPVAITNTADLRFEYNATNASKSIVLPSTYIDVKGTTFANSITLSPYTSAVLIKQTTSGNKAPSIPNQSFSLNENSPSGTIVGTVTATDPDAGQIKTFSIASGNAGSAFAINASTGVLTVATSTAIKFEATPSFALVVKVQDNGTGNLSSQATVTVAIQNVNEKPVIADQTISVNTNTANGTVIKAITASDPDAGQVLTWSIVSGNTDNAFSISPSTGVLSIANSAALNLGINLAFALVTKVQDNGAGNLASQATVYVNLVITTSCSATGYIAYQKWSNIVGNDVSALTSNTNYPDIPSSSVLLTSMEAPLNSSENFGARLAGYICAPLTGSFTFCIASDESSELWLSTNDNTANKIKIASVTGYTNSRQWDKYVTQKSVPVNLSQGQSYYIEALMKGGSGSDNFSLG